MPKAKSSKSKYSKMSDSIQTAMEALHNKDGYECKDILGQGTYGSVVRVSTKHKGDVAAKIVKNKVVNLLEIREWDKFSHPNVLRLLETLFTIEGVVVFITELMVTNLFSRLQSKEFRRSPTAIHSCRRYACQALQGLDYLHRKGLCHLDLRAENIFLAEDDRAVVADFSGLCKVTETKKFCPLPHSLRPPEMLGPKRRVDPAPVDLWATGLLLANLFLGKGFYSCTVKHPNAGTIPAVLEYKDLFGCDAYVEKFMQLTYPTCRMPPRWKVELIRLIQQFLEIEPKGRISTELALCSTFFSEPDELMRDPEEISLDLRVFESPAQKIMSDKVRKRPKWRSGIDKIRSVFNTPPFANENVKKKKSKQQGHSDHLQPTGTGLSE